MNGKRRIITLSLLLVTLLLSFAFSTSIASATPISSKKARLRELQAKLEKVYHQVDAAVEKYNQANSQLETVKGKIKENERLLKVAEYNLRLAKSQLSTRAATMYRTHDVSVFDVLFAVNSFDDLVTQLDLMERLGKSDAAIVTSITAYRRDIKDRRVELDADKKVAAKLLSTAAEQKAEIVAVENRIEGMTAGLKSEIRRLEAAAARRAQQTAQNTTTGSTGGTSSGTIVDPGGSGYSAVVGIAQQQLGKPYVYGGSGPNTFDCSGLTMFCYAQIGISLPHSATLQAQMCTPVPLNALQPGDLVFFGSPGDFGHVGISTGGSGMIHAPHTGAVVSYGSISGAYMGGRP